MKRLFTQFSFPGGIPSHVAPETPGSIHEGGELGYSLLARLRRRVRQPGSDRLLRRRRRRGRDRARSPRAGTPTSSSIPRADGAVLPILHLNGYKIANPTVLARIRDEELTRCCAATATSRISSRATSPRAMHRLMAATLDDGAGRDRGDPGGERARDGFTRAAALADDRAALAQGLDRAEGGRRARRSKARFAPTRCRWRICRQARRICGMLEDWMRSYRPEELFDAKRRAAARDRGAGAARASGAWAPIRTPTAGCCCKDLALPDFRDYAVAVAEPGAVDGRSDARRWAVSARRDEGQCGRAQFPRLGSGRDGIQPARRAVRGDQPHLDGRDRARTTTTSPRRPRDGSAERASLPGLARRLSADRAARPLLLLRGLHPHRRFDVQPARQVAQGLAADPLAAADRVAELPADHPCLAPGPQRLQPPGPRFHRPRGQQEGRRGAGLSAAGCQHAALGARPLPAQPRLRQRHRRRQAAAAAVARHGRRGAALHGRARHLGHGRATTTAPSRTS